MKRFSVDFPTRVKLAGILGSATAGDGGITKLHTLMAIYDQIRFNDEEMRGITVTDLPNGFRYTLKDPIAADGFRRAVEVENAQAALLVAELTLWSRAATIDDLAWLDPLMDSLGKRDEPAHEFKRRKV